MCTKQVAATAADVIQCLCITFNRGTDCDRAALAWCRTAGKAARVFECASKRDLHRPVVVKVGKTTECNTLRQAACSAHCVEK